MDDRIYYHALYHQLTHWAGFYAVVGLLISLIVILATTKSIDKTGAWCCYFAIVITVGGSWFFLERMYLYSRVVKRMLSPAYISELAGSLAEPLIFIVGAAVTCALGLFACCLTARRSAVSSESPGP